MDTLCIPPTQYIKNHSDLEHVKGIAIDGMNKIYAEANATLVLDSEIQKFSGRPSNPVDLITLKAMVSCCGWSTRSWTLQEGALSPDTYFALSDGPFRLSDVRNPSGGSDVLQVHEDAPLSRFRPTTSMEGTSTSSANASCIQAALKAQMDGNYEAMRLEIWRETISPAADNAITFYKTWNALLRRASTQTETDPVILANILRLSPFRVLQQPEEKWVSTLIRNQPIIPIEILFNPGPRSYSTSAATTIDDLLEKSAMPERGVSRNWFRMLNDLEVGLPRKSRNITSRPTNRWVPVSISGAPWRFPPRATWAPSLAKIKQMKVRPAPSNALFNLHGRLFITQDDRRRPLVALVRDCEIHGEAFNLSIPLDRDGKTARLHARRVLQPDQDIAHSRADNPMREYCFLIDRDDLFGQEKGALIRGAELHVLRTETSDEVKVLATIYSNPLILNTEAAEAPNMTEHIATLDKNHVVSIVYGM
jgi:hypothetical protein